MKKKCFVIRRSPPAVPGCKNKVNRLGNLTIGFGHGRSTRLHATLAEAKKAWTLVLTVLGITANDLRCMAAETDEEELLASDGSESSDSSGYSDMPDLVDVSVRHESPFEQMRAASLAGIGPISSSDEEPSATDEIPEAMRVTADEKPTYLPSTTSLLQPSDTFSHELVTTGFGPADNQLNHLAMAGRGPPTEWLSLSGRGPPIRLAFRMWFDRHSPLLQLPLPRERFTIMSGLVRSRAETVALYETAPIVEQPDTLVMLTQSDEPHLASMTALGSPCRECVSWHKPYFLRLLLSQWRNIAEVNRCCASRDRSVNKKPRCEYF
jgi:hypothetical protein